MPEYIYSTHTTEMICRLWHICPSIVFSVLIANTWLPALLPYYGNMIEEDGKLIPLVALIAIYPVTLLIGFMLEFALEKLYPMYVSAKKELK